MAANSSIYLCRYNNYANHEEKKLGKTIQSMDIGSTSNYGRVDFMSGIDFNPGDGVNTTLICNRNNEDAADYIFVLDEPMLRQPSSRWFILKSDRLRNGQYRLTLKRDLIADFYSDIKDSPIYVQKATLDNDDPMIYNDEGIKFNQIKTSQTPLPDATNCGWIVGYCQSDGGAKTITRTLVNKPTYTYSKISDCPIYKYVGTDTKFVVDYQASLYAVDRNSTDKRFKLCIASTTRGGTVGTEVSPATDNVWYEYADWDMDVPVNDYALTVLTRSGFGTNAVRNEAMNRLATSMAAHIDSIDSKLVGAAVYRQSAESLNAYDILQTYLNTAIYDSSTGKTYTARMTVGSTSLGTGFRDVSDADEAVASFIKTAVDEANSAPAASVSSIAYAGPDSAKPVYLLCEPLIAKVSVELTEIASVSTEITIAWPESTMPLNDMPYSMFCIPCPVDGKTPNVKLSSWSMPQVSKELAMGVASSLATGLGGTEGGFIYDLQYLPYCPIADLRAGKEHQLVDGEFIWVKTASVSKFLPIIFCPKSSFELTIPKTVLVSNKKVSHCCDRYRLMSPNFANFEEFDPAMNDGVAGFHVNCTYKPYTPYICVHMIYGGLYGSDFEDNRGLTLGGDFSLPVMSDAWTNYQIQNKNYANIFDRQMAYNEQMQVYNRVSDYTGAVAGSLQGSASGFMMGGAIGAVVGGVASLGAGITDAAMNESKYQTTRQYQIDMYNYNLQNIQAKPDTLVKTSSININNTTWPVIEYFTCTDKEKQVFREKLEYNGMTVMRMGTLSEFMNDTGRQYFQGQLIQCDNFHGDANMFAELQNAIAQGFHIIGG